MNPVIKALNFRHACKLFDSKKKISEEHLEMILTAAHLSPTSLSEEIDSCPIEGFEKKWVEKALNIDT